jgi:hypothetical protein
MRSRRYSGLGRPSSDTKVSGRRVTSKAPSAHVEGGSGCSEASPTAILQDTHSVEEKFCELRLYGVLGSSRKAPGQLAGWWRTRSNFLPQARWVAYCGTVAARILVS